MALWGGINDVLTVYSAPNRVKSIQRLAIFDRWGGLIFDRRNFFPNDEKSGWQGDNTSVGTFVYIVEIELFDGQRRIISGDVSLIR